MQTIALGHSFVVTAVFWEVKQKLFVSVRLKPAVHMSTLHEAICGSEEGLEY